MKISGDLNHRQAPFIGKDSSDWQPKQRGQGAATPGFLAWVKALSMS